MLHENKCACNFVARKLCCTVYVTLLHATLLRATVASCMVGLSYSIGNIKTQNNPSESDTEYSGEEDNELVSMESICVVCLLPRTSTWIFMPCRHANYCADCSHTIEELGQPCPVCRSVIQSRFEIFTN